MLVADVRGDVVALGHLPGMRGAGFLVGHRHAHRTPALVGDRPSGACASSSWRRSAAWRAAARARASRAARRGRGAGGARRAPRPPWRRLAAALAARGHALLADLLLGRPRLRLAGLPGRRVAAGPARAGTARRAPESQKIFTNGSWPSSWGRKERTPTMIPSTPMKRVSRPTRIALSAVSAMPRPRIAEPRPASWTAPVVNESASASRAASSVCCAASANALTSLRQRERRDGAGDDRQHGAGDRRDQRDLVELRVARLRRAVQVDDRHADQRERERRDEARRDDRDDVVVEEERDLRDRARAGARQEPELGAQRVEQVQRREAVVARDRQQRAERASARRPRSRRPRPWCCGALLRRASPPGWRARRKCMLRPWRSGTS